MIVCGKLGFFRMLLDDCLLGSWDFSGCCLMIVCGKLEMILSESGYPGFSGFSGWVIGNCENAVN
jgi:hypothetical protein